MMKDSEMLSRCAAAVMCLLGFVAPVLLAFRGDYGCFWCLAGSLVMLGVAGSMRGAGR